ncbi:MAG: glycosyltransferase family 2 protein [Candidatus Omnitrophica bacterium]|nr:glycosyltransferase family 2 protein [Candidatus Omnitrophota bacterium]
MKLSILIPTFNEEQTIERLLRRILETAFPIDYEVVIVDDHSTDHTYAIERRLRESVSRVPFKVLRNRVNKGKGACIRQGLKHATGDLVVIQDGDLEYDPRQIPRLLQPILDGNADIVCGSRFLKRRWPEGMGWASWCANRVLTGMTNVLYGLRVTDLETCYKVMKREQLTALRLRCNRFEFEPEAMAKLAKQGRRIVDAPITYHGRSRREGKKIRAKDFFIACWTLLRYRF